MRLVYLGSTVAQLHARYGGGLLAPGLAVTVPDENAAELLHGDDAEFAAAEHVTATDLDDVRGEHLAAALAAAGLPTTGKVADQRKALAAYHRNPSPAGDNAADDREDNDGE